MSEHEYDCPLCGLTASAPADVYAHLMTAHRKSAISNALLEATGFREASPESTPRTS